MGLVQDPRHGINDCNSEAGLVDGVIRMQGWSSYSYATLGYVAPRLTQQSK